jgi:hypothetical protein
VPFGFRRGSGNERKFGFRREMSPPASAHVAAGFASGFISVLGPQECLFVTFAATADTSRFCSSGQRDVMRVAVYSAASTSRTPTDMPLRIRLRIGKFWGGAEGGACPPWQFRAAANVNVSAKLERERGVADFLEPRRIATILAGDHGYAFARRFRTSPRANSKDFAVAIDGPKTA